MNILAIGSHPDDLEYGCGGTLIKFKNAGHKIFLFVLTKGEVGGDPEKRFSEQKKVAARLGAKLFTGNFGDTKIQLTKELINNIEHIIKKTSPNLIFGHYPEDTHQDHRNVAQATITATRYARNVLFYEVPTSINFSPSVFVDVRKTIKQKFLILGMHRSQVQATKVAGLSILESSRSCTIFRGFQNRVKYAEGFTPLRLALDFNI